LAFKPVAGCWNLRPNRRGAIASFNEDDVATPLGEAGGEFTAEPMGGLILHINREVMHHGGEIGVLRDLYGASFTS